MKNKFDFLDEIHDILKVNLSVVSQDKDFEKFKIFLDTILKKCTELSSTDNSMYRFMLELKYDLEKSIYTERVIKLAIEELDELELEYYSSDPNFVRQILKESYNLNLLDNNLKTYLKETENIEIKERIINTRIKYSNQLNRLGKL